MPFPIDDTLGADRARCSDTAPPNDLPPAPLAGTAPGAFGTSALPN
ncbi:MAG: hypothetical protein AAGG50_13555 [Bacteroidota bacterium]